MSILDSLSYKEELQEIWRYLPHARLVGGVVRDLLSKRAVTDIDMATPEPPDLVMEIFEKAGIKVLPTGLAHGTITAFLGHRSYEITTLRKDIQTDGRRAEVVWTDDWQEDAARRDFTINAMFCDHDGQIWDFYNGQQDLINGRIRFVGNAHQRIEEDVLRILRFFRFYARYGLGCPDVEAIQAIKDLTDRLETLSAERVWSELQKILVGPRVDLIMDMMDEYGVLSVLMPFGYNVVFLKKMIRLCAPQDTILQLAGLVRGKSNIVAQKLRLSRKQEKLLQDLQRPFHFSADDTEIMLVRLRAEYSLEVLVGKSWLLQTASAADNSQSWDQWRKKIIAIERPIFPVTGKELMEMGIDAGPEMGNILHQTREWWLTQGCKPDLEACLEWLKTHSIKRIN